MAASHRKAIWLVLLLSCIEVPRAQSPQRAPAVKSAVPGGDITLDAASSEMDYRNNTLLFREVIITQGRVRVAAERARATGLDFADTTWILSGQVKLDLENGALRSDEATVVFRLNRVALATIGGKPAEFEQRLGGGAKAVGRADVIVYDLGVGTVSLRGQSWLSDGRSEIRGDALVYNVRAQRVEAGQPIGDSGRVRITIRPPEPKP
jgi:lipopolysaccharide transport protein LptA